MSTLIIAAILYGVYCLYQSVNADSINWKHWLYQRNRIDAVRKAVERGETYEESPIEKRMHQKFGYKYDGWYGDYVESGEFDAKAAWQWNQDNLYWK